MSLALELLALAVLIGFSALYSGSEIGFYRVSAVQVDLDARGGSRRAALMRWLLRDEAALLVTILIGNNLALELATHVAEALFEGALGLHDPGALALAVTLALTPLVFLFGEALPKDLFRQRPHALTGLGAPLVAASRVVFWPLERALRLVTVLLEHALGLGSDVVAPAAKGKEAVLGFLAEGRRHGVLSARAEALASNALRLRGVSVGQAMVPWRQAEVLRDDQTDAELFAAILAAHHSRLPVVRADAGPSPTPDQVLGYVHQLEVLHNWSGDRADPPRGILERLRPLPRMGRDVSVDRALGEFHASGRRIALVVEPTPAPAPAPGPDGAPGTGAPAGEAAAPAPASPVLGLVSVNDILERISGEVAR